MTMIQVLKYPEPKRRKTLVERKLKREKFQNCPFNRIVSGLSQ